jgi:protein phosphatase
MDIGYITNIGKVRAENQDRFLILLKSIGGNDVVLCAVADGMGGTQSGSLASNTVMQSLHMWWENEMPILLSQELVYVRLSKSLDQVISQCNYGINELAKKRNISTGTTLTMIFVYMQQIIIKHVGDTRIYLNRNNEWILLTKDHTWEQQEYDKGVEPQKDPQYIMKKSALTNALGAGINCVIDTQILQRSKGDKYLLCSDGFYRYIDIESEPSTIPENAQDFLVKMENRIFQTDARDNYTAVLLMD